MNKIGVTISKKDNIKTDGEVAKPIKNELKQLLRENSDLKDLAKQQQKELEFWMNRADEGGGIDFTDGGFCGLSSNALVLYACGKDKKPKEYPRDLGDWGRCERTIMTIPSKKWLVRLFNLSEHKEWKEFEAKIIAAVTQRIMELNKEK
jgi:hypothetical protein